MALGLPASRTIGVLILCGAVLLLVPTGPEAGQGGLSSAVGVKKERPCVRADVPLPSGWRRASVREASGKWRRRDPCRYLVVSADFNGDGLRDQAELLISDSGSELIPFAFMAQIDGTYTIHRLGEPIPVSYFEVMGIETVKSGSYRTACGKGYWECGAGEPKVLRLKNVAIDLFKEEGTNSFIYWDVRTGSFKQVWISD